MATLSHFPLSHLISLPSSRNTLSSTFYPSHFSPLYFNGRNSIVCLASAKKTRPSKKVMSDEELCDVLREFVASVGLPEDHVPSTKDLSIHGRKDLANIVRRRGHKLIKALLSNPSETKTDGSETVFDEFDLQKNLGEHFDVIDIHEETGQEEKDNDLIEESTDVPLMVASSTAEDDLVTKHSSAVSSNDQNRLLMESQASLEKKVENFMRYGQLDIVDDQSSSSGGGLVESEPVMLGEGDRKHYTAGPNGSMMVQCLPTPPLEDNASRDINVSVQGQTDTSFDSDVNLEGSKVENEIEINHLKQMLHLKELELSRLKEGIEKEKEAILILQSKAESEISKAQKLISEKDAELLAAEESLSELMEAKIQYPGEARTVEVAGSFNGWHQSIKMEPQPPSSLLDPVGTRKSRFWSTTLWLYPGVYEIKFIVDGHWKIDPQREVTFKGGIENNLLRVDR